MRRLLAAGFTAAALAAVAACGGDGNDDPGGDNTANGANGGNGGNTSEVCTEVQSAQTDMQGELQEGMTALEEEELEEDAYAERAIEVYRDAFVTWSEGLRGPAEDAEDQELSAALTGMADALEAAAPELTMEALQGGQIPGAEELDEHGSTVSELCGAAQPSAPPTS